MGMSYLEARAVGRPESGPDWRRASRRVAVVAVPPVTAFDLTIPELVFGGVSVDGEPGYAVVLCTADPGIVQTTGSLGLVIDSGLEVVAEADTVVVTGSGRRQDYDSRVLRTLLEAARAGHRIASICTGAFILAEAGLLEGKNATTYWPYTHELAARYPGVKVAPSVLFTEDGAIFTSAGLAAGIDLCLHIIRADYGAAVANETARLTVVAPVRPGGQAQFIQTPLPPEYGGSLARTREWAAQRLSEPLTLARLAAHAHVSVRSFSRRFQRETGLSPLQWLLHQRVILARELLETTSLTMNHVARRSGLGTSESLRRHMLQRVGLTPSAYRATFSQAS